MCQTYKDLIQDLRDKAEFISLSPSNITNDYRVALKQAANAIERLCIENDCLSEDVTELVRELNKQKWIPVTERCPEKSGDYLVFDDCRNLYVNEWHCLLKKWQYDDSRITHWMPLPEPPKEET